MNSTKNRGVKSSAPEGCVVPPSLMEPVALLLTKIWWSGSREVLECDYNEGYISVIICDKDIP